MERLYHNHDKTIKNGLTKKTDFKKNIDENGFGRCSPTLPLPKILPPSTYA